MEHLRRVFFSCHIADVKSPPAPLPSGYLLGLWIEFVRLTDKLWMKILFVNLL